MRPIIEVETHNAFLNWINDVVRRGDETPAMKILCSHLDGIIMCRRVDMEDPEPHHVANRKRTLYDSIKRYISEALETLKLELPYDPNRIFDTRSRIHAINPENRIKLQLFAMIRDGAYTRLGKCLQCGRYFFAHRSADIQKFCGASRKGVKSPCAVAHHIQERKQKTKARQRKRRGKLTDSRLHAMKRRLCEIVNQRGGLTPNPGKYVVERAIKAQLIEEGFKSAKLLPPVDVRRIFQKNTKNS